jgi:hypothetical protein
MSLWLAVGVAALIMLVMAAATGKISICRAGVNQPLK